MKREIVNGSFEPLWRANARSDADKFKAELLRSPGRRKFLGGVGAALMLEYVATRRAVALPLFKAGGPSSSVTGITNARTGTTYNYVPDALYHSITGDTILLPAGLTYQYLGTTYYYANYLNNNCARWGASGTGFGSMYLGLNTGPTSIYGGFLPNCDYGTIQGVGSANNGRALLTPPYGILAAPFDPSTDTEMYFVGSTPASNFTPAAYGLYVLSSTNSGQFDFTSGAYTGIDTVNNGLTGITSNFPATIPAGSVISSTLYNQNKGMLLVVGSSGWTFTNLEVAYCVGTNNDCEGIRQSSSNPGGPYVGSMTLNNCYIHDCNQGAGTGYAGIANNNGGIFAYLFDTELAFCGIISDSAGQCHNLYIAHIQELMADNCYSHHVNGNWCLKSRANLNIVTYSQIRGERTDANTSGGNSGGSDFSNGGLVYLIGNVHQLSLNAHNSVIDWDAESQNPASTTQDGGGPNNYQELYAVNCNLIGPSNGVGVGGPSYGPLHVYNLGVGQPQFTPLSQGAGGSLAARTYFAAMTNLGTSGGETLPSQLYGNYGGGTVTEYLSISANNLITAQSVLPCTGANDWNCYLNYGDPVLYGSSTPDLTNIWWDSGHTEPVFSTTTGGTVISVTGTVTPSSPSITTVSGLSGLGSLSQLVGLTVYVGGVSTGWYVQSVNEPTATLTMNAPYAGGSPVTGTITFGWTLWCGFTYQTALGDSVNVAMINGGGESPTLFGVYDGSLTAQSGFLSGVGVVLDPGVVLTVNAPPSGPSWATGINFWAVNVGYNNFGSPTAPVYTLGQIGIADGNVFGMTKQNSSTIMFGNTFTTPSTTFYRAAIVQPNLFLQNSSPIAQGTNFTEPTTGLVNNNPTKTKLQWYRRCGLEDSNGATMDCWYAVVPTGGLSSYSDTVYIGSPLGSPELTWSAAGVVSVWRGCAAAIFDSNFAQPAANQQLPISVTTASGNVTMLAAIRTASGTAASGWTQLGTAAFLMNAAYKSSTSAFSGLSVTETGGTLGSDDIVADALIGTSAAPTLVSAIDISGDNVQEISFTISSANAGDVLYLMIGETDNMNVLGVGKIMAPVVRTATAGSPILSLQNCILANFNQTQTGGVAAYGDYYQTVPSGYVTTTTCQLANPYISGSFQPPLWATVFNDPVQTDYNYALASGSPALGAATGPGTSPEGQNLVPQYQTSWSGSPTPGTPIPAKAARSDISNTPGATAGAIGALS